MAIQPIDLQTLYTQMDKVSKSVVQQQQGVQLQNAIAQEKMMQQEIQKGAVVKEIKDKAEMQSVKERKKSNQSFSEGNRKKQSDNDDDENQNEINVIKDPGLGKNIDVSG